MLGTQRRPYGVFPVKKDVDDGPLFIQSRPIHTDDRYS